MDNNIYKKSRGLGFWLLVIGIVVVAVAIAVPNLLKTRDYFPGACINNLRQIDGAKDQWAIENKRGPGNPVVEGEVVRYMPSGKLPVCDQGGTYSLNAVGQNPTCSIGGWGHSLPVSNIISNAPTNGLSAAR